MVVAAYAVAVLLMRLWLLGVVGSAFRGCLLSAEAFFTFHGLVDANSASNAALVCKGASHRAEKLAKVLASSVKKV